MKLLVSRDWLRNKIATDPDVETDAGAALAVLEGIGVTVPPERSATEASGLPDEKVVHLRMALGTLVRLLRHRDKVSVADLADRVQVPEEEVRSIERDPHHVPRPRTLYHLAKHFNLPVRHLMQMSGVTRTVDRVLYNEAVRFAARSEDMSTLTDEERQALNSFVKLLVERDEG